MDKIAVLIPCYNEEKTIAKVVSDVKSSCPRQWPMYMITIPPTALWSWLRRQEQSYAMNMHRGKGNVIRRMFREIDAECYLMIDGDDTYPLDCAQEMVDRVLQHQADMVVGDRLSSLILRRTSARSTISATV